MDWSIRLQVGAPHISIQGNRAVTLPVDPDPLRVSQVLHPICHHVRVRPTPIKGVELHHGNEAGQVVNFGFRILLVDQTRQIEQLCTLG